MKQRDCSLSSNDMVMSFVDKALVYGHAVSSDGDFVPVQVMVLWTKLYKLVSKTVKSNIMVCRARRLLMEKYMGLIVECRLKWKGRGCILLSASCVLGQETICYSDTVVMSVDARARPVGQLNEKKRKHRPTNSLKKKLLHD